VKLPAVIAGQKGLVDEKDLIIPNMRGIMSAKIIKTTYEIAMIWKRFYQ